MRYVRFLKPPRFVVERNVRKSEAYCLITVTSDLGDSFLPNDVQLTAELLSSQSPEQVLVKRTVQWTGSMRSLPVTFPVPKSQALSPLRVRVGLEASSLYDDYGRICDGGFRGLVSAWSADFDSSSEAMKLVERRFLLPKGPRVSIWEETGESIARHLWDAGITLSYHLTDILDKSSDLSKALLPSNRNTGLQVLELGTGCGMVGITLAQIVERAKVLLTDLPEAREIVERNIGQVRAAQGSSLQFQKLDWDDELPENLQSPSSPLELVLAADCTYNSDSSPALVNTLARLARISPKLVVAIAMKMRHSSEKVFFDLMAEAKFLETTTVTYPLLGDVDVGEETVNLHVYQYNTESRLGKESNEDH